MSKSSQTRRLSRQINGGFTPAEVAAIDEHRGPYSRAGWLRNAALAALDLPPERPGKRGIPTEDIASVTALAGSVGRTAGATIQLAKALRAAGHTGFHELAERVLTDLRRHDAALAQIIERLK